MHECRISQNDARLLSPFWFLPDVARIWYRQRVCIVIHAQHWGDWRIVDLQNFVHGLSLPSRGTTMLNQSLDLRTRNGRSLILCFRSEKTRLRPYNQQAFEVISASVSSCRTLALLLLIRECGVRVNHHDLMWFSWFSQRSYNVFITYIAKFSGSKKNGMWWAWSQHTAVGKV